MLKKNHLKKQTVVRKRHFGKRDQLANKFKYISLFLSLSDDDDDDNDNERFLPFLPHH